MPCYLIPVTRTSHYLTMRDGVRVAVDLHLPAAQSMPLATILHQTRYFRGVHVHKRLFKGLESALEQVNTTRRRFLEAGFAWVDVDARGSGASFGTRPCPWSPDETEDGGEIVDWITRQPWSNGRVGATGVSYAGTAAEMLLLCRHPAVKAIAPRFSLFDVYTDVMAPGGVPLRWFTDNWKRVNDSLDANTYDVTIGTVVPLILRGFTDAWEDRRTPWWTRAAGRLSGPGLGQAAAGLMRLLGAGVRPVAGDFAALDVLEAICHHRSEDSSASSHWRPSKGQGSFRTGFPPRHIPRTWTA